MSDEIKLSEASVEEIEQALTAKYKSELRQMISRLANMTPGVVYTPKGFPDEYAPKDHTEDPNRLSTEILGSMVMTSALVETVAPGGSVEIEITNMTHGGVDHSSWLIKAKRLADEVQKDDAETEYFAADFKDGTTWKLPVKAVIADMEEHEKASGDDDKWPRPISRAMAFRWFLDNCDKIEGWILVRSPMFDKPDFDLMNDARWYSPETET
ncbi:hypothetical protein [Sulfitobacter sp. R18_1]|uniref:hypothetical protein n=1 Tax=Sulfitobacter sp. R18_1 TaxID=2821104 RepID=UPI001ADD3862|nr:hypothetical protein [Sulfitobacter sp. R18_1]MBO9428314.1 hypothetical protein [Sulfitobacter sp. R18_1]